MQAADVKVWLRCSINWPGVKQSLVAAKEFELDTLGLRVIRRPRTSGKERRPEGPPTRCRYRYGSKITGNYKIKSSKSSRGTSLRLSEVPK